ncbi:hypothetical protein Ae201684P_004831 [Aphanomyces euteiches]|uniref:RNase III domain-containing protein n=1 Tax=Aphanomyces euteiches TaxID=100861 RepID=A0A6G0XCS1_9STRA|nr:hypothetical protein Ae201684_006218 [Aphanomyces euteiches]KAH9069139.1 hypothetical protein Ae201684P_004831 [Aphanomyces euteiches]
MEIELFVPLRQLEPALSSRCRLGYIVPLQCALVRPGFLPLDLYTPDKTALTFQRPLHVAIEPSVWTLAQTWMYYVWTQVFVPHAMEHLPTPTTVLIVPLKADDSNEIDVALMHACLEGDRPLLGETLDVGTIVVHSSTFYRIEQPTARETATSSTTRQPLVDDSGNVVPNSTMVVAKQAQSKPKILDAPKTKPKRIKKRKYVQLVAAACTVHPLSRLWEECRWVPTMLYTLGVRQKAASLHAKLKWPHETLLAALIPTNNHRLAFLGDAVLKIVVSLSLVRNRPFDDSIRHTRHRLLLNATLATSAQDAVNLADHIDLMGFRSWPYVAAPEATQPGSPPRAKLVATTVEALAAAAFLCRGMDGAIYLAHRLGVVESFDPLDNRIGPPATSSPDELASVPHTFADSTWAALLSKVLTDTVVTDDEQAADTLEWARFLGDAVGYFAIASLLYAKEAPLLRPSHMTWIRNQLPRATLGELIAKTATKPPSQWLGQCWDTMLGIVCLDGGVQAAVLCYIVLTKDAIEKLLLQMPDDGDATVQ